MTIECLHTSKEIKVLQSLVTIEVTVVICSDCGKVISKPLVEC